MNREAIEKYIALAKDVVVLFRDGAIILLAILLIAFPIKFNSILVEAGFEEGSVVGFKWKSKLVQSNEALEKANETIISLKEENDLLLRALEEANEQVDDIELSEKVSTLQQVNSNLMKETDVIQSKVLDVIESNYPLIDKINKTSESETNHRNSEYTIGLQTLGVSNDVRMNLNNQIAEKGYTLDAITHSYNAGERPRWFAAESTVFYYAGSSRKKAEDIATLMSDWTGQTFTVKRGNTFHLRQPS